LITNIGDNYNKERAIAAGSEIAAGKAVSILCHEKLAIQARLKDIQY
jgi:hypothetical protein